MPLSALSVRSPHRCDQERQASPLARFRLPGIYYSTHLARVEWTDMTRVHIEATLVLSNCPALPSSVPSSAVCVQEGLACE